MATATKTDRSAIPTPLFAVVGATDLAVERVRAVVAVVPAAQAQFEERVNGARADVEKRVSEFDPRTIAATVQEIPTRATARALEVASKGQMAYEDLAARGKSLVDRIRSQASSQELAAQYDTAVSRGKAAVTTARRAADDTTSALLGTIGLGKSEAEAVATTTRRSTKTAAKKTQASAKKTATTAKKRATATKTATKSARTSATKTATAARKATAAAADKVGD
jgi:heparin binding hemagglutinin HbhA